MKAQRERRIAVEVAQETVLRPFRNLFVRGLIAVVALTTPVYAVLYWLTVPSGPWPVVFATHLLVIAAMVLGLHAVSSTTLTIEPDGVREHRAFGRTALLRPENIGSVLLVHLYDGSTLDTLPQLFVTSTDGQTALRMRGQFWSLDSMERVAEELEAPVTRPTESMTRAQLRRSSPHLFRWYERLPGLR